MWSGEVVTAAWWALPSSCSKLEAGYFVCCPQWCACPSSAAASLAHCKGCRAVGKLEVKAEAAADATDLLVEVKSGCAGRST